MMRKQLFTLKELAEQDEMLAYRPSASWRTPQAKPSPVLTF